MQQQSKSYRSNIQTAAFWNTTRRWWKSGSLARIRTEAGW
jgi:hypothetical protein